MTADLLMSWSQSLIIAGLAICVWALALFCILWATLAAFEAVSDTIYHFKTKWGKK